MPTVTGQSFAETAYSFRDSGYTYQEYDCVGFTNLVRRTCGLSNLYNGTNTLWRNGSLVWQGTIADMAFEYGDLVQGCYLFRIKPESDPDYNNPPIPSQYYMDGIGNVTHVGIWTNLGLGVMQSGGYGGTGVHDSSYRSDYWTHAALCPGIDYAGTGPTIINNPDWINGFYCSPNLNIGSWSAQQSTPTAEQKANANNIKSFFILQGWTLEAICGMLGNMQAESQINPFFIQATHRNLLPSSGTDPNLLGNNVMKNFYDAYYGYSNRGFAIGLVQWDGYSNRNGEPQQKLVAYAISNNYNWYDGWCQCYRLQGEHDTDDQYHFFNPVTIGGVRYTFDNYVTSTADVVDLAHAWQAGYERNAGGLGFRGTNAQYWYQYFTGPDAPDPVDPSDPEPPNPDPTPDNPQWLYPVIFKAYRKELKRRWIKV